MQQGAALSDIDTSTHASGYKPTHGGHPQAQVEGMIMSSKLVCRA